MKAELKSLTSTDIDERTYWPEDEEVFGFNVEAAIGPSEEAAADYFTFFVCTPGWVSAKGIRKSFGDFGVFGTEMIIVSEYDWEKIRGIIEALCDQIEGDSWSEIAQRLGRYGRWEYQGHS